MKKDYKLFQSRVIKIFHQKGYLLNIENKKIKDKDQIEKIKEALLSAKFSEEENNFELINYIYGDIISKIINDKYQKEGITNANYMNLEVLKNIILLPENDKSKQLYGLKSDNILRQYYGYYGFEMLTALTLAKFSSLYCYPLDDIYKKDNNYHLERKDILDFSKLNLTDFNPEIIDLTKKGENEAENKVKSLEKKIRKIN